MDNGRGARVAIVVVDEDGVARDALAHEADLLVDRDGVRVVHSNLEFDPDQPSPEAVRCPGLQEPEADVPSAPIATTAMPTVPR